MRHLTAFLVVGASPARADESEAEASLARGVELRRARKDAEALVFFRRAYVQNPTPRALAQVALAEGALFDWVAAESDLTRALSTNDAWIELRRSPLVLALGEIQGHLATLDVSGPPAAELWVGGALVGRLPLPALRIDAKPVVIEVRAPGFVTERREVLPLARGVVHETIALRPELAVTLPPSPTTALAPVSLAPPPPSPGDPLRRSLAWSAAGTGVLFGVTGVASILFALNRADTYNNDSLCDVPGRGTRASQCGSYANDFNTARTLEIASFVLAGAAAAGSVALFLTLPSRTASPSRVGCRVTVGGIACGGVY